MPRAYPVAAPRERSIEQEPAIADGGETAFQQGNAWTISDALVAAKEPTASQQGFDRWSDLEAALGSERLAYLNGGAGRAPLQKLIDGGFVDSFIDYVREFNPSLHASDGRDFTSFMNHPRGSLLQYKDTVPTIRSPHRLTQGALQGLKKNFQDHSKQRPLVVIVLGALDLDGSHHGNTSLDPLVNQDTNLVLAIEAGEKKKDALGALSQLAEQYGQDKRIQDIVLVGHGGPSRFDLAGKVTFDDTTGSTRAPYDRAVRIGNIEMVPSWDSLDSKETASGLTETERFVRKLLLLFRARWGDAVTPRLVMDSSLGRFDQPAEYGAGAARKSRGLVELLRENSGKDVDILAGYGLKPGTLMVDPSGRPTTAGAPAIRH